MRIGIPKEIKNNENRVAITPSGVMSLKAAGHDVFVEFGAGMGSGFTDDEYVAVGATLAPADTVWNDAEMIIKVKEPIAEEFKYFRPGLVLFTYLHLAADPVLTKALCDNKVFAVAYETVTDGDTLPLLTPMSEVAGRMAVQIGSHFLEKYEGGKGILLSGVSGVKPGKVTVIGGGIVGTNAARAASGLGADVTILDITAKRLRELDTLFNGRVKTLMSTPFNIAQSVAESDLVIGAVLIPGAKAPRLVTEEMVKAMTPGSVIVDVAIDQGGIVETADHSTTHDDPVYIKHGVVHYAVANMPGAVARTSTIALTNVTIPYALKLANLGAEAAVRACPGLATGVNTVNGHVTYQAVAEPLGMPYMPLEQALAA